LLFFGCKKTVSGKNIEPDKELPHTNHHPFFKIPITRILGKKTVLQSVLIKKTGAAQRKRPL